MVRKLTYFRNFCQHSKLDWIEAYLIWVKFRIQKSRRVKKWKMYELNIARGTTDPEIDSMTWIKFSNNVTPLALVAYLATRWRHLHKLKIWRPDGATCISCKFDHQMAPLALAENLATRWRHLHKLQILPPNDATWIHCKFDHQMAPLALVANLATRWRHLYQ